MKMPTHRSLSWQLAATLAMAAFAPAAHSSAAPVPLSGKARVVIEQFLVNQTAGLPGKVSIRLDTPRSGPLPVCDALEPFLPRGAQLRGRVSVGLRCNTEHQPWTRYVQAYIGIVSTYYVTTRQIAAGQALMPTDSVAMEADITTLPASVIVDPAQLIGMSALNRIASGAPIRREFLRGIFVLQQGQHTKIITRGPGFIVSTEGKAMTDAAVGAVVQVRIQGGTLISGIVGSDGIVERVH